MMKMLLKVLDAIKDSLTKKLFKECEEYYAINNPFVDDDNEYTCERFQF